MRNRIKSLVFLLLVVTVFSNITSCSNENKPISAIDTQKAFTTKEYTNKEYYPTDTWRTSTPEEQGVDSEKLYNLVKGIKENKTKIDNLIIVRNGYIITEANFSGGKDSIHALNSCTKSITSALVGIAIKDGYIKNTDMKLLDIYPDMKIKNNNPLKKQITLEHLLTMSAGFDWNEWSISYDSFDNPSSKLWRSSDTVQFMLDQPVSSESGKVFNYNSGESHMLSAVFTKLSGITLAKYADDKLFKPLGITKKYWAIAPDGITYGGYGLNMTARDMAKFGYLYLKNGKWNGQQIIPESWVEESTRKQINENNFISNGYGYQWWINSFGGYSARGLHGQYIFVMPELNMVVVFQSSFTDTNEIMPLVFMEGIIIPAAKSSQSLPPNSKSAEMLKTICGE